MKKRRLRWLLGSLLVVVLVYISSLLIYGAWTDWQPTGTTTLNVDHSAEQQTIVDSVISLVTWNVGYGGLGAESDFCYDDAGMFYSGFSMIHSPRALVEKNIQGATAFLQHTKADFFLLQEADVASARSYDLPQYADYQAVLPGFAATMAINYKCERVPIPLLEPWHSYGHVLSGLATFCRFQPVEATRHQLPGQYPMPNRLFQLDRCAALHRFSTSRGKDLVVINLHNSAYDPGDKIKAIQLPYLRDLALAEYRKGNYVVLGGDWNQCPPNFRFDAFRPGNTQGFIQGNVPADFFPEDWQYAYDPSMPTNRKACDPYVKGQTFETLIDFFLVSPNVVIRAVKGVPQDFQFSDHQPVWVEIGLQ